MAKQCAITGAKPKSGHNVSHSVRRTKRTFGINLQRFTAQDEKGNKVRFRATSSAMRTLSKSPTKRELARAERKAA